MKIKSIPLRSLLAIVFACLAPAAVPAAPQRPNVVVVMIDDLGATGLACDGSDLHQTPHLDRLAGQGIRFTAAYSSAPVCTPTRAALMTGKHPARLGMTIWHEAAAGGPNQSERLLPPRCVANLPHREQTIAELLRQVGYRTFHVGKWHLGDAKHYPETHGFDANIGGTLWGAPPTYFWPYRGPFHEELRYVPGLAGGGPDEYLTDRLTDEAIDLLQTAGEQPFFLSLCYHSVHTPIEAKPNLIARYRQEIARRKPQFHRNPTYAGMVHSVDENIGRLIAVIDRLGLANNTLLVVTSDNGGTVHQTRWGQPNSNAPLRSGKGSLYEGGVRVPLIVRWPTVTTDRGQTCSTRVVTHDLFATIVEAARLQESLEIPSIDGVSLLGLLRDATSGLARTALFWHYPHYYPTTTPVSTILQGRHKLLHFYEDDRLELYDLTADPSESNDLAAQETGTADQLRLLLDNWLNEVGAGLPVLKDVAP